MTSGGISGTGKRRDRRRCEVKEQNQENLANDSSSLLLSFDRKEGIKTTSFKNYAEDKEKLNTKSNSQSNLLVRDHPLYDSKRVMRKSRFNNEPVEVQKYRRLKRDFDYLERKISQLGWAKITERDRKEYNLKRELIKLMESKKEIMDQINGFMPSGVSQQNNNTENQITSKLTSDEDKKSRQQLWEERVLKSAVSKQDVDEIYIPNSEEYEYVFDKDALIAFTKDNENVISGEEEDEGEEVNTIRETVHEEPIQQQYDKGSLRYRKNEQLDVLKAIEQARKSLPIYRHRSRLMNSIKENQVLIIIGETGSGKTTQLPQYLVEDGYTQNGKYQIVVTQPRRVAATSIAARVAEEMNVKLGQEVGYSIRFDDKTTTGKTILKYATDGMLLRECLTDPMLTKYSCIIIDEAHERTLATDILLGLLKGIIKKRCDLKILISSATMNAEKFSHFFDDCPILKIAGKRYPVDIHYTLQPEGNYINASITTVFQIHTTQPLKGDILLFLTGQEEIENTRDKVEEICAKLGSRIPHLLITPIYASLPQDQQALIFQPTPDNCRKLVLATNIAETSLTIDGIKYVIDPGFVKVNSYVPSTGMTQLLTIPCSKASVDQRAGRAGRVGPGKCFRIFTKWSYENELELLPKPEILRTNLSNTVLLLLSLGVKDLLNFAYLDKPAVPTLIKSLENLYVLGALNSKGQITELGRMMCEFPCEPEFAKVLHTSATHPLCQGVLNECLTIIAMLHETTSLFIGSKREAISRVVSTIENDHLLYLEVYNQWQESNFSRAWCQDHKVQFKTMLRVRNIRKQLYQCCQRFKLTKLTNTNELQNVNLTERITRSFIAGFPSNVIQLGNSGYHTIGKKNGGLSVSIHPSSVVFKNYKELGMKPEKYVLYHQLMLTSKEYVRDCIPIPSEKWLLEMVPQLFQKLLHSDNKRRQ